MAQSWLGDHGLVKGVLILFLGSVTAGMGSGGEGGIDKAFFPIQGVYILEVIDDPQNLHIPGSGEMKAQ